MIGRHSAAKDEIGVARRKHRDCFDENNENFQYLLQEKHKYHKALLNDPKSVRKKARAEVIKTDARCLVQQ